MRHSRSLRLPDVPSPAPVAAAATPSRATGRRFLVASLPCFRLERCGVSADELAALVDEEQSALRVQVPSLAALRQGLTAGLSASEARAMVPELRVILADAPAEEEADLRALLRLIERFSPAIRPIERAGFALEIGHVRDEVKVMRALRGVLTGLGHRARLVVADEVFGGFALASWRPELRQDDRVIGPGGLAAALAGLPIAALRPDPRLLDRLELLGLRQVGELARLDAASVSGRFGAEGLRLHRVARGEVRSEPIDPPVAAGPLQLRRLLPDAAEQLDGVLPALDELVARLCAALSASGRAAMALRLRLRLDGGSDVLLPVRLGQPRRAPGELMLLIRRRLDGLTVSAPVTEVGLELAEDCSFVGQQQALLSRRRGDEELDELVGRLTDALGEAALYRARPEDRHRPEGAWSAAPARGPGRPIPATAPRPTLLLREPRPAQVWADKAGIPAAIEVDGARVHVVRPRGPERLAGEWWDPAPFDRDYFDLGLRDGRRLWVFQDRSTGAWWLQGMWD